MIQFASRQRQRQRQQAHQRRHRHQQQLNTQQKKQFQMLVPKQHLQGHTIQYTQELN
jgi:hypothetical protein